MTPQSDLEIKGNFLTHPFAELVAEISHAGLDGSLVASDQDRKCVIYFKDGSVVFAVSNARSQRLFDIMLRQDRLTKDALVKIPNFANDFELTAYLEENKLLTRAERELLFKEQIESIVLDILTWPDGDWCFSLLKRVRDGLAFDVNTKRLLFDYARRRANDAVLLRFRSMDERFRRSTADESALNLSPDEAFVLSRIGDDPLTASDLTSVAAMAQSKALHAIYTLWLGGLIVRDDWQSAFSGKRIEYMRAAKLELKQEAKLLDVAEAVVKADEPKAVPEVTIETPKAPEITISLEEYLERVENAKTFYDILGVEIDSEASEIKQAYFGLAKMFHPDRFHADGGPILQRIQKAFTELSQANEALKNPETREVYDYRIRKELTDREKPRDSANADNQGLQIEQAVEHFERGFSLLIDKEYEAALPFLARAVHFDPNKARYHAYYGKALSADKKQRHKAEAEMQKALKLDPNNPAFRNLLAEFFIQVNLPKRAEGELNRLLAVFPDNREALDMLASLRS